MAAEVTILHEGVASTEGKAKQASAVELTAVYEDGARTVEPVGWEWTFKDKQGMAANFPPGTNTAKMATLKLQTVPAAAEGTYTATATLHAPADPRTKSATFKLTVEPAAPAGGETTTSTENPPKWPGRFAWVVLGAAVAVMALIATKTPMMAPDLGLSDKVYDALTPASKLAARVIGPAFLVGVGLIVFGLAMAIVEWRGRFATAKTTDSRGGTVDPAAVIKALGDLRGAGLVLISGLVVVLATAWMTNAATAPAPTTPAPTASQSASASP